MRYKHHTMTGWSVSYVCVCVRARIHIIHLQCSIDLKVSIMEYRTIDHAYATQNSPPAFLNLLTLDKIQGRYMHTNYSSVIANLFFGSCQLLLCIALLTDPMGVFLQVCLNQQLLQLTRIVSLSLQLVLQFCLVCLQLYIRTLARDTRVINTKTSTSEIFNCRFLTWASSNEPGRD